MHTRARVHRRKRKPTRAEPALDLRGASGSRLRRVRLRCKARRGRLCRRLRTTLE
jgi:hypothetical protein